MKQFRCEMWKPYSLGSVYWIVGTVQDELDESLPSGDRGADRIMADDDCLRAGDPGFAGASRDAQTVLPPGVLH